MPTPITLTEQENEWLQNMLQTYYNEVVVLTRTDTELALHTSVLAKLIAADTL